MGILRKFIKLNGVVVAGGASFTAYQYPELRRNPGQLLHAMVRGARCASTFGMMAVDYLKARQLSEISSETHIQASNRMYECFRKNGGPYIKLG